MTMKLWILLCILLFISACDAWKKKNKRYKPSKSPKQSERYSYGRNFHHGKLGRRERCKPRCPEGEICCNRKCIQPTWGTMMKMPPQPRLPWESDYFHIPGEDRKRKKRATDGTCEDGEYKCKNSTICATECDGNVECPLEDDEENCLSDCQCAKHPRDRVNCEGAYKKITKDECLALGCCWDSTWRRRNRVYCYQPDSNALRKKSRMCSPNLPSPVRENCGWKGITDHMCACRGCCCHHKWKSIWCYAPRLCQTYLVEKVETQSQGPLLNGIYDLVVNSTCIGPYGSDTAVYQHQSNTFVHLYYVQENLEWAFGGVLCSPFFGARWQTTEINPDAEEGGWEEFHAGAWVPSKMKVSCTLYY